MNNNSHIHIENHVSVHQSGHDYVAANAGCAGLAALGTLVGLGALGFGLYLVAEPTFEMVLDVAYGLGDAIGAMAGALDILRDWTSAQDGGDANPLDYWLWLPWACRRGAALRGLQSIAGMATRPH